MESLALLGLEEECKTLQRQASHSFWNGCLSMRLTEHLSLFNKIVIENTIKMVWFNGSATDLLWLHFGNQWQITKTFNVLLEKEIMLTFHGMSNGGWEETMKNLSTPLPQPSLGKLFWQAVLELHPSSSKGSPSSQDQMQHTKLHDTSWHTPVWPS